MSMSSRRSRFHSSARRVSGWALSWLLAAATWMLLVDTSSVPEFVAGAAAASVAAIAARLVWAQHLVRLHGGTGLIATLPRQLARVPIDLWLLVRELARALAGVHRPGRFHALPFDGGRGPQGDSRRAALELVGSLAPNTIVLGVDEHRAIVHQLVADHRERAGLGDIAR